VTRAGLVLALAALLAGGPAGAAAGDAFVLGPGDRLEVAVLGETELPAPVRVDESGAILAPLLGAVEVGGLTIAAATARLREAYVARGMLRDPQVSISLSEGRPYFVGGDVREPGAFPSRPMMTVEEAVALAGGYRSAGFGDPLELGRERVAERLTDAWVTLFTAALGVARRRAEIALADEIAPPDLPGNPLPREWIAARVADETAILVASNAALRRRDADLEAQLGVIDAEIVAAREVRELLERSARTLAEALTVEEELQQRGLQVRRRTLDVEGDLAAALARAAAQDQTESGAERRRIELLGQRDQLGSSRAAELLAEIAELEGQALNARARLRALAADAALAPSLADGGDGLVTVGHVIRRGPPEARVTLDAAPEDRLLPGDALIVTVRIDLDRNDF
jgi:protein involved in polysaccharide export with SLBB domain